MQAVLTAGTGANGIVKISAVIQYRILYIPVFPLKVLRRKYLKPSCFPLFCNGKKDKVFRVVN
jgi:hypothetical protein